MIFKSKKEKLIYLSAIFAIMLIYFNFYTFLYNFDLWLLNKTGNDSLPFDLMDDVESISTHIVPLMIRTYSNTDESDKSRRAAAFGLIKADKEKAEELFMQYLDSKNENNLSEAIRDLSRAKSIKPYRKIVIFVDYPNAKVRWAVADYLGKFKSEESIYLLRRMMDDPDKNVRSWATYQLQRLNVLPHK